MDIPSGLVPSAWLWSASLVFTVTVFRALLDAPWSRLRDGEVLHVFLGTTVAMIALWNIKAGVTPGLHFHLLAVTTLTLMFGWSLAVVAVTLVLAGITVNGSGAWESLALNALLMGIIPIVVTSGLLCWARQNLPRNFFIYIFFNAFFAAGLSGVLTGLSAAGLLWFAGAHSLEQLIYEYLAYFPLMFFPEAVLNGMLMTMFAALRPNWVWSFDDDLYIKGK